MRLEVLPWDGSGAPSETTLRERLEADGFSSFAWSDPPRAHYEEHAHDHDESIWLVAGEICFGAAGHELVLTPGDRLMLPAGTSHTADAGPSGATYLIGQKL